MATRPWPTIIVGIPAFNEQRTIEDVVRRSMAYAASVVVVDDGSNDETAAAAVRGGAVVLRHEQNSGKGAAVANLFAYAMQNHADILVLIDGDGQHDPDEIPQVAGPCINGSADIVVGSRFISWAKCDIPRVRRFGQAMFNGMTALASGVGCSDSQSGFRAFGRRALCEMQLSESTFSVECEMQFEARARGLRLTEVPISCSYGMPPKRNILVHGYDVFSRLGVMAVERRVLGRTPGPARPNVAHSVVRAVAAEVTKTYEAYEAYDAFEKPVLASGD